MNNQDLDFLKYYEHTSLNEGLELLYPNWCTPTVNEVLDVLVLVLTNHYKSVVKVNTDSLTSWVVSTEVIRDLNSSINYLRFCIKENTLYVEMAVKMEGRMISKVKLKTLNKEPFSNHFSFISRNINKLYSYDYNKDELPKGLHLKYNLKKIDLFSFQDDSYNCGLDCLIRDLVSNYYEEEVLPDFLVTLFEGYSDLLQLVDGEGVGKFLVKYIKPRSDLNLNNPFYIECKLTNNLKELVDLRLNIKTGTNVVLLERLTKSESFNLVYPALFNFISGKL